MQLEKRVAGIFIGRNCYVFADMYFVYTILFQNISNFLALVCLCLNTYYSNLFIQWSVVEILFVFHSRNESE